MSSAAPASAAPAPAAAPPAPRPWPREVTQPLPRFAAPYSHGEDVFALPPGGLVSVLRCLKPEDTGQLRLVCRDAEAHVAGHRWADTSTPVRDLARWRAAFPRAVGVKLHPDVAWTRANLALLEGLQVLDASGCGKGPLSSAAQDALGSIPQLVLTGCSLRSLVAVAASASTPASLSEAAYAALPAATADTAGEEGAAAVVRALRKHRGNTRLVVTLFRALASIAASGDSGRWMVIEAEGVSAILGTLRKRGSVPAEVTAAACQALTAIADTEDGDLIELIIESNSWTPVVTLLTSHASSPVVVAAACTAIAVLASCHGYIFGEGPEGIDEVRAAVYALLQALPDDEAVAAGALKALGELYNFAHVFGPVEEDIGPLVEAMTRFPDSPAVAAAGCAVLAQLVLCDTERSLAIKDGGGYTAVVSAMRHHAADAAVCAAGCDAIQRFCDEQLDGWIQPCITGIVEAGGYDVVIAALREHAASKKVCQEACGALKSLAQASSCRQRMAEAGAIPLILQAVRAYKAAAATGCGVLQSLATGDAARATAIVDAGGVATLTAAAEAHGTNSHWSVFEALAGASSSAASAIVAGGGREAALAALPTGADAVSGFLAALVKTDPQQLQAVIDGGGIEALVAGLKKEKYNANAGYRLLDVVMRSSEAALQRGLDAGAVQVVVQALKEHYYILDKDHRNLWLQRLLYLSVKREDVRVALAGSELGFMWA